MDNDITKYVTQHEQEFHEFDEDVRAALWGPKKHPVEGSGRERDEGIVFKVNALWERESNGGLKAKLATGDKVLIGAIIAILEAVRLFT